MFECYSEFYRKRYSIISILQIKGPKAVEDGKVVQHSKPDIHGHRRDIMVLVGHYEITCH